MLYPFELRALNNDETKGLRTGLFSTRSRSSLSALARSASSFSIASRWSAELTIAYRRNMLAVFHPPVAMITLCGTPAFRRALAAEPAQVVNH